MLEKVTIIAGDQVPTSLLAIDISFIKRQDLLVVMNVPS